MLKEPLLKFLVAGAGIFALSLLLSGDSEPTEGRVVVDASRIQQLEAAWERQWRRPPTEEELGRLVDEFVHEEILYREAMAMGLDRDDTIVRRRLAQKLEFLIEDLVVPGEPEVAELEAFFEENPERFRQPARVDFEHLYFSTDRRGDGAAEEARRVLREMSAGDAAPASGRGDPLMLNDRYAGVTRRDVTGQFGAAFAEAVFALEPGEWSGPIESGYGLHLVRVSARVAAALPPFSQVRLEVREAYLAEQRRRANWEAMRRIRDRYEIVIEPARGEEPAASPVVVARGAEGER